MNEKKDDLTLFPFYANKPGFINKVSEMISEFKNYCVSPSQLFDCVKDEERLSMSFVLKKGKDILLVRNDYHWW